MINSNHFVFLKFELDKLRRQNFFEYKELEM